MISKSNLPVTLAALLVLGGSVAAVPAAAQSQGDNRLEMFGPGDRGWFEGRPEVFGQGRRGWFEDNDRNARNQYEQGYRSGRDDERRMGSGYDDQDVSAAMEFLNAARRQMQRGDLRAAWVALGRAEVRLAARALPSGADEAAAGAAVGAIRAARRALRDRDVDLALVRTERALDYAQRGRIVGRNVPGWRLDGAGMSGERQPLTGGGRGRDASGDWNN